MHYYIEETLGKLKLYNSCYCMNVYLRHVYRLHVHLRECIFMYISNKVILKIEAKNRQNQKGQIGKLN